MAEKLEPVLDPIPSFIEGLPLPDDKFLYLFTPAKIDNECYFGFPLKTGVKVLSLLVLIHSISYLVHVFSPGTLWLLIVYIVAFVVLLATTIYAFLSTMNEKYSYAKTAYIILGLIFAYQAIKYVCKSLLKIVEFITPWDSDFLNMNSLVYILGYGVYLFINLYFIWVLYCFMLSIKGGIPVVNVNNEDVEKES